MDLELISTEDLMHELMRRHKSMVIASVPLASDREYDWRTAWNGDTTEILGLIEIIKFRFLHARIAVKDLLDRQEPSPGSESTEG